MDRIRGERGGIDISRRKKTKTPLGWLGCFVDKGLHTYHKVPKHGRQVRATHRLLAILLYTALVERGADVDIPPVVLMLKVEDACQEKTH